MNLYNLFCKKCKEITIHRISKINLRKGAKLICLKCCNETHYHNFKLLNELNQTEVKEMGSNNLKKKAKEEFEIVEPTCMHDSIELISKCKKCNELFLVDETMPEMNTSIAVTYAELKKFIQEKEDAVESLEN